MDARSITYSDGSWLEGNPPLFGPMTHALWMASVVFDGARSFNRLAPDLDRHCARVIESARSFGMTPEVTAEVLAIQHEHGLRNLIRAVEALAAELSVSGRLTTATPELETSLEDDRAALPKVFARFGQLNARESYRLKLELEVRSCIDQQMPVPVDSNGD